MMKAQKAAMASAKARLILVAVWKRGGSMNIHVETIPIRFNSSVDYILMAVVQACIPPIFVDANAAAMAVARL